MKTSWPASLAVRLTLWYTLLSVVSFTLVFSLAYYLVATILLNQVDEDLVEDIDEFELTLTDEGVDELWNELQQEVAADGAANLYFRLFDSGGSVLRGTGDGDWQGMPQVDNLANRIGQDVEPILQMLELSGREYPARTIYGPIAASGESYILQIAETLEEREEVLELIRVVFMVSLPLFLLLSLTAGWFLARRSMRGVEEVTSTAIDISNGAINHRVRQADRGEEIERLAATFNGMLDKIQILIKGMREMTDNIAHDLKSPLARIRGLAETSLTSGEIDDDDQQQLAGSVIEECDRLLHLINTMLDISETEAGLTPQMEPLNLTALVEEACEIFQALAVESDIELSCECHEQARIRGNRQFLQRLIGNLLDNAIKYSPAGSKVTIVQTIAGNDVVIEVADTGPGIQQKDLTRIFERFYRCDTSRSKPGSGLGLSLANAIARAHQGSISVRSVVHEGSLFVIRLPVHAVAAD